MAEGYHRRHLPGYGGPRSIVAVGVYPYGRRSSAARAPAPWLITLEATVSASMLARSTLHTATASGIGPATFRNRSTGTCLADIM